MYLSLPPLFPTSLLYNVLIEKASSTGILEVQSKTFDRISFKWNGKAGAKLMVRFNCLSTDFSRIKGVKGIPLRVHMDTMLDGIGSKDGANGHRSRSRSSGDSPAMERAFAKIKLFRDKVRQVWGERNPI
jgi:hypothetical protein